MFKHGFGTTAVKYQFTIDLKEVILPDMFDEFDGTETLCIAFERKNKGLSYTEEKKISLNDNDEIIADFTNESFTSDVTLYRDKSGFVREKTGTLTLLQRKYGTSGSTREAFKAIGMAHIPFHQFTDNQAHQKELFFGGIVSHSARIVCVIAGVAKDGGQPINPSGTNDPDDGDSLASKSLTSTASQLNHNSTSFSTKPPDPSSVTTVAKTNVPFTLGASSSNTTTSTTKSSSTFFSLNKKSSHNEDKEKEKDTIQTQSMLSFHSSDDAKFENSFLYQNMKRRVEELEDSMLASAEIMDFDKAKIKELTQHMHDIEGENDSLKQQSNDLHFQMEHLQTDYEILMRENESLKATIAKYTLEGGKLQSLLQKATDELNIQQDAKFKLEQLLKEKNDECEDLLAELIKTKVAVGDLNGELDETKKQLRILRGGGRGGSAPAGGGGGGGGGPGAPRGPGEMTDRRPPQPQSNGVPRERVPPGDMGNRPAPPSNSQPYNNPQYSTPNYNSNPGPAQGRQRQGVSSTDYYMNNGNYTPSVGNNNGYNSNPTQSGYNSNNPTQNGYNSNQNVTNSSRGGPGPGAGPDYYSYNNTSNNNMNGSSSRPSISQPPPAPASSSRAFIPSQGYGNPTPSQSQSTNSNGNSFTSSIKRGFGGW